MEKKDVVNVSPSNSVRLIHPMHTVLVSCAGKDGKPNIITLAWAMPTSISPPLVAVSIAPRRHSHSLIEETGEFVVNIPTMDILDATFYCGRVSGRDRDKFKEAGLTPMPARKVKPPIIGECVAHLECKLYGKYPTGDHTIFVGEIVEAYANKGCFSEAGYNLEKAKMIFHVGGNEFATLEPKIHKPKT
ncbi:MAG: flavin reductase family protein [Candidatus Bathyarchaeota archaeon]|nr:flavin reductase family protein [Candidatus Bathyarchaeota archaeon]MDW8040423.1 flavin reductase family protein [Nitrososphaerota archaeon]